ncbi:hypothetical protein DPMN_178365 [Dreissena polymorpha]|uniref:Uncharacterized protein n=1 Tax=Dreissena polymorpha TaxID=45954 RepID=A0A9D4IIL7_DREPO|nr:hypothetical protein DPMN_178365 [Dreissena polymorpha]
MFAKGVPSSSPTSLKDISTARLRDLDTLFGHRTQERRKLAWFGNVIRHDSLFKIFSRAPTKLLPERLYFSHRLSAELISVNCSVCVVIVHTPLPD